MLRYYAAASAIVVVAILILLALPRPHPDVPSGPQYHGGPGTPRPGGNDPDPRASESVGGVAPWALSAVPECFHQESEAHGPAAFVAARLPAEARRLPPGSTLAAADCTLAVGTDTLTLRRGAEHLIVPPQTRAYALSERLAVLRLAGAKSDLRVYRRVSGGRP